MLPLLYVLLLLPLLVVLPTTFYNPGPFGKQNYLGRFSLHLPHCHFIVVRASFCKRRRLSCALHLPAPHHGSAPASFVPSRAPLVLEFPCDLALEPVISKTGYPLPVGCFRLSLPGRFNPGGIIPVASVWSCCDLEELFQLALHRPEIVLNFADIGMLIADNLYADCRYWYADWL